MKKKLVVLLAVVMMFAFSASAYAATFSDVSERSVTEQDAIAKAVALGIIEGYEDGTFGPDKTITRAEFAKIAVTAAGAKETATMLEANASSFKDVRANSWYTGWINAAESLGIFKGDQNGNFRPNDTISNQEAITVLLRLLGYNDNLTGSWPVNYVTKANQIGLLDDVNIVASAAAKRGDVVVMLGEALDTAIVTYDKDTNEFVYKQTTKSGSSYITLMDDSFEGSFIEVSDFAAVNQVRNVADKTLNWSVGGVQTTITKDTNENKTETKAFNGNMIIDENTAVSYNSEGLFDLEHHQGKVYYVTEGGKMYARFIEVESYIQKVSDPVKADGTNKVKVNTTTYNAVNNISRYISSTANNAWKNSSYYMYFNDDDQVYRVVSDREFTDKAYYVKSLTTASARLVGTKTKTVNMNDADTLIYDNGKFVAPSDLEVGDAIVEIKEGELYVKVADASGDFTRTEYAKMTGLTIDGKDQYQHKATIGGKKYVFEQTSETNSATATYNIETRNPIFYEEDLEVAGITSEDVYNNNVKFLLNKDNTIAAIVVDETSSGTTLYGVVVDGGGNSGTWNKAMNSITLFTQEGYTVTYDFTKNCTGKPVIGMKGVGNDTLDTEQEVAEFFMGQPVAYKLDSNGEIKVFQRFENVLSNGTEVEVKNNAYLVNGTQSLSLASNVIIFEVGKDKDEIDVSLVTRSSLLSGGDFTPEAVTDVRIVNNPTAQINAYAKYDLNSNKAVKALAYTDAKIDDYFYGVIKAWKFTDADHAGILAGGNTDYAVTLVGDDKVYDLDNPNVADAAADRFIIYSLSGDKLHVEKVYKQDAGLKDLARLVNGYNDGLINIPTTGKPWDVFKDFRTENTPPNAPSKVYTVMTDANTVVYVLDSNSGDYREGALSDISRNSYVFVPVIDSDGYADVVLIDEYPHSDRNGENAVVGNGSVYVKNEVNVEIGGIPQDSYTGEVYIEQTGDTFKVKANSTFTNTYLVDARYNVSYSWKVIDESDGSTYKTGRGNSITQAPVSGKNLTVELTVTLSR